MTGKVRNDERRKIRRINELYHKSKAEGLTEEEKKEQKILRQEYIESFRESPWTAQQHFNQGKERNDCQSR